MYRIMIVEDDRQISSAIKRGLSAWGCDVCETEDFTAVTGIFRDYSPHLVLLDISLPFCDGYYWCRIRQHEYSHGNEYGRGRFCGKAL